MRSEAPTLDIVSHARRGPTQSTRITIGQIEQVRRTVRRVPEVMVKVTGGGRKVGAVAAHLFYISHNGELELETDDGQRVPKEGQKELLRDWHLELSAGQYRPTPRSTEPFAGIKLVHNIVLSMPAPTPPDKVLAAARTFARERFGLKYRYAMTLHTHQEHPHVHIVVKAEGLDASRLHIDKAMLREWRQDFARMMRDQGIAANATPRAVRGRSKGADERDGRYWTKKRRSSYALRDKVEGVARELARSGTIRDPAHAKLAATRKAVVAGWLGVAALLAKQGQTALAGEVRQFVRNLPPALTDRERIATELVRQVKTRRSARTQEDDVIRERAPARTR
jgi:hypothetical protein